MTVEQFQCLGCRKVGEHRVPGLVDASDAAPNRDGVCGRVREVLAEFIEAGPNIFGIKDDQWHSEKLECVSAVETAGRCKRIRCECWQSGGGVFDSEEMIQSGERVARMDAFSTRRRSSTSRSR